MNDIRDGHYTLGKAYLNAEQYDKAIPHFEQSVALDGAFIDGYHALALAYFGEQRKQICSPILIYDNMSFEFDSCLKHVDSNIENPSERDCNTNDIT